MANRPIGVGAFEVLLPLVDRLCKAVRSVLLELIQTFQAKPYHGSQVGERTVLALLDGLEQSLAASHSALLDLKNHDTEKHDEQKAKNLLGTVVTAFSTESGKLKASAGNSRLTVLLAFKDTVNTCFRVWAFDEMCLSPTARDATAAATFKHTISRLRHRVRGIFENIFAAEALESLEGLIKIWEEALKDGQPKIGERVLALLGEVHNARPKITMSALFNSIYSRTHPSALDPDRKSTLSTDLSEETLAAFLLAYTTWLDDDATEEIWVDCLAFLRDVLTSPLNHRQILPQLLDFTVLLGQKVDNTNFGDQQKMRRELGVSHVEHMARWVRVR
jgi:hypothetical protein